MQHELALSHKDLCGYHVLNNPSPPDRRATAKLLSHQRQRFKLEKTSTRTSSYK